MPWHPDAIRKPITKHDTPMSGHRGVCNHVAVSESASLYGYFSTASACSHFYVRKDGTIEQYVDTRYRAPAQLEGNATMISVETQGGVTNANSEPWTAAQVESLASIAAWAHEVHGIPLEVMPDSKPTSKGIGYHRLGIDPWRVSGGERWSSAYGKICPGAGKIAQIPTIVNRARQMGTDQAGDGTMAWTDAQIAANVAANQEIAQLLRTHALRMDDLVNTQLPALRADVAAIKADQYLIQVRMNSLTNVQMPDLRQSADAIEADVDAIRGSGPVPN